MTIVCIFCNPVRSREYSGQMVFCGSTQKKSAVCLKSAVQVTVEDVVMTQVGGHSKADLVASDGALNRNTHDAHPVQHFLLRGWILRGSHRGEDGGPDSLVLQPVGNLPGLAGGFPPVRLEGVDGSQDFQCGRRGWKVFGLGHGSRGDEPAQEVSLTKYSSPVVRRSKPDRTSGSVFSNQVGVSQVFFFPARGAPQPGRHRLHDRQPGFGILARHGV